MNLFENIAKIIRNGASTSIAINKRVYGVTCRVYFPKREGIEEEITYKNYHYEDNYDEEPDVENVFLIPKVYTWGNDNNFLNDPLTDDEVVCYIDWNENIPLYSKFEIVLDNIQNRFFYVEKVENFQTTSMKIVKKLTLVQLIDNKITNEDEMDEMEDLYQDFNDDLEDTIYQDEIYSQVELTPNNEIETHTEIPKRRMNYTPIN